jgi:hypothetical protein
MRTVLRFSIPLIFLLVGSILNANNALGHTFSGDESASFLAGVEMTKIELKLAAEQVVSNATNAKEHADHLTEHITANDTKEINEKNSRVADELNKTMTGLVDTIKSSSPSQSDINTRVGNINDILSEVVSARIDKEQLDNVTVKALVINNLVGEGLEHYSSALGMPEEGHEGNRGNTTSSEHSKNQNNETARIVDMADYQSAQAAVSRAIDLYNEIKPTGDSNSGQLIDSLNTLKTKIDKKSAFDEIDKIVDEKITPLLNDMFKLNLAEEEGHSKDGNHSQEDTQEQEVHGTSQNENYEANTD